MKVLFIGNSHTFFNDMPRLFASMCEELTGEEPEVVAQTYGGRSFKWHWEEQFSLRFALMYGGFDYCVLQQQAHPFPGEEETRPWFLKIARLCRSCGVVPVIFMTWAEKAKPENLALMSSLYRKLSEEEKAPLAPIGEIFGRLQKERPDIDLYFKDGEHASPYGDYLIACCLARLLTGKDISGLSSRAIDFGISMEDGQLSLCCDPKKVWTELDREKTAFIRKAVAEAF